MVLIFGHQIINTMERKIFLQTGLGTAALLAFRKTTFANTSEAKPFKIAAGKGRFNESFLYKGKNPNDIKISGKDTGDQLAMLEYIGYEKTGPSLHVHFHQDEIFYVIATRMEDYYINTLEPEKFSLKSFGVVFFFFLKILLKFDKLLKPHLKAISPIPYVVSINILFACPILISFKLST
jgi:hypothetical protein